MSQVEICLWLCVLTLPFGWGLHGVSPNGGMPNLDIVTGWVEDDGTVVFQVVHLPTAHPFLLAYFTI